MNTVTIGKKDRFGIEYALIPSKLALLGSVRVWFNGLWIGDNQYTFLIGSLCERLNSLRGVRRTRSSLLYADDSEVPTFQHLHGRSSWSFGEAFDDFSFVYYAVAKTERLHWVWRSHEEIRQRYPDYPAGLHRESVDFAEYDDVLGEFLRRVNVPDDVEPGIRWAFDPRQGNSP